MKASSFRSGFGLAFSSIALSSVSVAQSPVNTTANDTQPVTTEEVVVTGSRIPHSAADINPTITVITNQQLEDRGFKNAFDALNNLAQNTGFTQGADYGNTFTPAANTISLRGLGPNHTLILVNGQRVADYPTAYNGEVNFVNLADIPSAAIDRIEVVSGGASAIYGSDAIAGVVNVILKDHAQGIDVNLKGGMTEHGAGGNGRIQVTGGGIFGDLTTAFAIEISRVEPIWAENRGFMNSTTTLGGKPTKVWERQDLTTQTDLAPPGGCAAFAQDFQNSTSLVNGHAGPYCGTGKAQPDYWTTQTGNQGENIYGALKYDLNPHMQLFGNVLLYWNHIWNNTRRASWTSDLATTGYFLNQNTGDYESWTRSFGPEETGGVDRMNKWWNDFSGMVTAGVRGDIGNSTWKYTGTYSGSVYTSHHTVPRLLASVDSYFLGPQLGTDSSGVPIYAPNVDRFNQPLTPTQFNSIMGDEHENDSSWLHTVTLNANGQVLDLPAGPLSAAGDVEWGTQGFTNHPDPGINAGNFYDQGDDNPASGTRQHYAAAVEFSVPILSNLKADLAARYDRYSFADRSEGKPTYNITLDYRPLEMLRLHAGYSTSFRAPDMNYIFQSQTSGYEAATTDYYQCAITHQPLSTCSYANYSPGANFIQLGNKNLGFENGRSFDYGVVFTPIEQVELSVDYWNLRINNEVSIVDYDELLRIEAACRLGQLNSSSSQCQQAYSEVIRSPANSPLNPNSIVGLVLYPINAAYERTDGVDIGAKFRWELRGIGKFQWNSTYTKVMSHYYDQGPGDQPLDLIRSFNNPNADSDFPDKLTSTLAWTLQNWSATVEADRYGTIINSAQTGFLTPITLVNLSVSYQLGNATLGVIVDNLFDTQKRDNSAGWPYYPVGYYLPYGRQGWLEFSYHFGPGG